DAANEILRQPVLPYGPSPEPFGVDHHRVAFEDLGAEVVVALDPVLLPAAVALVAPGVADPVQAELVVQDGVVPWHAFPVPARQPVAERLALGRELEMLAVGAVQ